MRIGHPRKGQTKDGKEEVGVGEEHSREGQQKEVPEVVFGTHCEGGYIGLPVS